MAEKRSDELAALNATLRRANYVADMNLAYHAWEENYEAKAAARLHHTNIVPVFGVGRQDGHHYFVMQFIAGLGLDVVLDDLRRLRGGEVRGDGPWPSGEPDRPA